jgi:hypothetical protein
MHIVTELASQRYAPSNLEETTLKSVKEKHPAA